jgi:hypothetical protein
MKPRAIFKGSYIRKEFYNPGRKVEKKQDTQVLFNITIIQP